MYNFYISQIHKNYIFYICLYIISPVKQRGDLSTLIQIEIAFFTLISGYCGK